MSLSVFPGELDEAVASWLQTVGGAELRVKSGQLIESYAKGQASRHIDLAAYLTTRLPATYAAVRRVLGEVALIAPGFLPSSMLDIGAGPGTASWAAQVEWPDIANITMIEADARFAELASNFAKQSTLPALMNAAISKSKLAEVQNKADLIIAAYVFAELAEKEAVGAALKLWQQTEHTLVIIEPGTPRGFARIKAARQALIKAGAYMIGPCPHAHACPMAGGDWCRFAVRLARSREHMHAKQATAPFEDESFSWIAVSRHAAALPQARIVAPPELEKHGIALKLCSTKGLTIRQIARRDKAAYKQHRKLAWGDVMPTKLEDLDV